MFVTSHEYLICLAVLSILVPLCHKKPSLIIFACIMCATVLVNDIFLFFIGLELLGIMSSLFVSLEKHSKPAVTVYAYNIFASLLFLFGILNQGTELGAWCTLIACLCKSAQFPFSNWLLQATHAHTFVSIFIHCATIIGLGPIFIYKFSYIFEPYCEILTFTTISGLISAVLLAIVALFETDIKKIMAMLTISSAGIMYTLCGLGYANIAILYFICHAFYKSIIFLIFNYFIEYYKTKDFRKFRYNHGINMLCILALMSCLGVPPFVGSYAKIALSTADLPYFYNIGIAFASILSNAVLIRLYLKCFRNFGIGEKFNCLRVWLLLVLSIPVGYIAFTVTHSVFSLKAMLEELIILTISFGVARKLPVKQLHINVPCVSCSAVISFINYTNKIIENLYTALAYKHIYKTGISVTKLVRNDFRSHVTWMFYGFIVIILCIIICYG